VLQDVRRILAVMKDGEFHRAPPLRQRAAGNAWAPGSGVVAGTTTGAGTTRWAT
jgi:hypothetical protein